jgi:hypothetical protein
MELTPDELEQRQRDYDELMAYYARREQAWNNLRDAWYNEILTPICDPFLRAIEWVLRKLGVSDGLR